MLKEALGFSLVLLVGCGSDLAGPESGLPRQLTSLENTVAGASNELGLRLLRDLSTSMADDQNFFFSPLSVSMNLGLVSNGAKGTTRDEFRQALGLASLDATAANAAVNSLTRLLLSADQTSTLSLAHSVWFDESIELVPTFAAVAEREYDASLNEIRFSSPDAADLMNNWASAATEGRIERITDDLPDEAVLAVLNATYFDADWTTQFDRNLTRLRDFHRTDGTATQVPFMERSGTFAHAATSEADIIEIPYGNGAFAMTVAIPRTARLDDLIRDLNSERWNGWIAGLSSTQVSLALPRFQVEWSGDLVEAVRRLGVDAAFSKTSADFTGAVSDRTTWIGEIRHGATIEVDEDGTVAAAVTGTVLFDASHSPFDADQPFLFAIRERQSGVILFMGVVNDPSRGE